MKKKNDSMLKKNTVNSMAIVLIPMAVAVNVIGAQISNILKLPFYCDLIGTAFISSVCGPGIGVITGILGSMVNTMFRPQALPFTIVAVLVAVTIGMLASKGMMKCWWKAGVSGVVITVISTLVSTPIVVLLYGGATDSGTSIISGVLLAIGTNFWTTMFSVSFACGIIDKTFTCMLVMIMIRSLPKRTLIQLPLGEVYLRK